MASLQKWALGTLAFVALSLGLASPAQAYHRHHGGGVSISFGDPYSGAYLSVPIGHRYHHRRHYRHYPYYPQYYGSGYGYHPYAYHPPRHRYRHHWRHRPHYYGTHYGWRDQGLRHHRKHWRHHRGHRWH